MIDREHNVSLTPTFQLCMHFTAAEQYFWSKIRRLAPDRVVEINHWSTSCSDDEHQIPYKYVGFRKKGLKFHLTLSLRGRHRQLGGIVQCGFFVGVYVHGGNVLAFFLASTRYLGICIHYKLTACSDILQLNSESERDLMPRLVYRLSKFRPKWATCACSLPCRKPWGLLPS